MFSTFKMKLYTNKDGETSANVECDLSQTDLNNSQPYLWPIPHQIASEVPIQFATHYSFSGERRPVISARENQFVDHQRSRKRQKDSSNLDEQQKGLVVTVPSRPRLLLLKNLKQKQIGSLINKSTPKQTELSSKTSTTTNIRCRPKLTFRNGQTEFQSLAFKKMQPQTVYLTFGKTHVAGFRHFKKKNKLGEGDT